jgi:lipoprotein-anchoring transpeptidase ErfK/SrfK
LKRSIAFILIIFIVLSLFAPVTFAQTQPAFATKLDVKSVAYASEKLNVYASKASKATLGTISVNSKISVISEVGAWSEILWQDQYVGYVETNKLSSKKKNAYYVYVELGSYTVTVYGLDSKGNYTKVARQFSTAIGKRSGQSPPGTWKISGRERWHNFSNSYAQYATKYRSGLYFHSPLYRRKDSNTLIVSSYNAIGTKNSSGCFRTTVANARWIYNNCSNGTEVKVVSGSPKGTRASAPKNLSSSAKRDPTD